jgi:Ca-activated chloride channel family protein
MGDLKPEIDHYTTLGLDSRATPAQIRQAYRRLVRRVHPDASTDEQDAEQFREVQTAYKVLSDPLKRRAYDQQRRARGYDRPPPIEMRITCSHAALPALTEPQMLYVLVDVRAPMGTPAGRPPLNLCLALDQSTSMKGARLDQVRQSAQQLVEELAESDLLSIVTFNDRAQVVLSGQHPVDRAALKRRIRSIHASGGTEIYRGLVAGLQEVERHSSPETLDYLILLTDGHTYGDEERCLSLVRRALQRRITVSTFGVGNDWNAEFLDEIAAAGGGYGNYVESAQQLGLAFNEWLHGVGSAYARDLMVELRLASAH